MLRAAVCLLLLGCGGDSRHEPRPAATQARPRSEAASTAVNPDPEVDEAAEAPPAAPTEPDFEAPFPDAPCPEAVRVRLAHESAPELPAVLDRAVAFRSDDGRRVRIAIANHSLELDAQGRFLGPRPGEARFELDAVRTYRRPLEPRVLGRPDSRRGALTHVRVVTPGPLLTFGHRDIGTVELTALEETRICGRVDLNDGFGRVRGAFVAAVAGPLPP